MQKRFNPLVEFYTKHNVSPVKQNIEDFETHYARRNALFRELGVLPRFLKGKNILEVGPGGGYNSVVLAAVEPHLYTLVEPNPKAREDIEHLFGKFNLNEQSNIEVQPLFIEEFDTDVEYDLVMCEGMVSSLPNKYEIIDKMDSLLAEGGIMLLSCADSLSTFFENIRGYFAYELTKDIEIFEEKVKLLVEVFGPHLETLVNFTRFKEDWCIDNLIGDGNLYQDLSMGECIEYLSQNYFVLQSSPSFLNDYTWYKKLPLDTQGYNERLMSKFNQIHHNLFHYQSDITERKEDKNIELAQLCKKISYTILSIKNDTKESTKADLIDSVRQLKSNIVDMQEEIKLALNEILELLTQEKIEKEDFSKYENFKRAFGRGQQYISFVKDFSRD